MSLRLPLIFVQNFSFVIFCFFALTACDFNSNNSSEREKGNPISIMGVDGPMAGADIEVYDLQDFLDDPNAASSLLYQPATTDIITALADDIELTLNAGVGPFMVVVTANATTTDLTTGEAPVVGEVKTILNLLDDGRVYASPLTSLAVDIAMNGRSVADDVLANLADAQLQAKAFFGFGMSTDIDIFTVPPILDETTTTPELQQQVAEYRAATETFSAVVEQLVEDAAFATNADAVAAIVDDALDGVIETAAIVEEVSAVDESYLADAGRLAEGETVADLLSGSANGLSDDYVIDDEVVVVITPPDSDNDGVFNDVDELDSDPLLAADPDNDSVDSSGLLAVTQDNCPNTANSDQLDTDNDGAGDVCDSTPNGDDDADTIDNAIDNCPTVANTDQANFDSDAQGDACDSDDDNDGVSDEVDAFDNNAALAARPRW